ncbi:MAG: hypothetical protein GYB32_07785 [Algicola sp.]|nr:hypothetical protein [Algicola sp.]
MRVKTILVSLITLCFLSCKDLIEVEDISAESVTVLAPMDNVTLNENIVTFSWEPLEYAETYQLQIVAPSFESPAQIVQDTIVLNNSFSGSFSANNYQWRIKALNFAYETQYTTQNLTIEE